MYVMRQVPICESEIFKYFLVILSRNGNILKQKLLARVLQGSFEQYDLQQEQKKLTVAQQLRKVPRYLILKLRFPLIFKKFMGFPNSSQQSLPTFSNYFLPLNVNTKQKKGTSLSANNLLSLFNLTVPRRNDLFLQFPLFNKEEKIIMYKFISGCGYFVGRKFQKVLLVARSLQPCFESIR